MRYRWWRGICCVSLLFIFQLSTFNSTVAQDIAPCTGWLATVDEASQQIVLSWHPSPDTTVMGYHICTGTPCLDYDTVFGRLDTTYRCLDHSPLTRHTYRLHVFDSNYNVSALTPHFGNMVLTADVPECETTVTTEWTPYSAMPSGSPLYTLWVRLEPFDDEYDAYYTTTDSNALHYTFEVPESATRAWLKVTADGPDNYRSLSNVVVVERRTIEQADFVEISEVTYDSLLIAVDLDFHLDSSFPADHYSLYRSIDGSPWKEITSFQTPLSEYNYTDYNINPYDSLYCYQLGVLDACGMNEKYSRTKCVVVPDPPPPFWYFPNVIVAGDADNGRFLPVLQGLLDDFYELHIYNRFGQLVFHTNNPTEGWTPPSSMPQGVYTYHLRCQFNTGDIKNLSGTFALIK